MESTTQRVTGWPHGDCVRTSYSVLLGIPYEDIPRLDPGAAAEVGQEQADRERAWLHSIGYDLVEISCDPEESLDPEVLNNIPEEIGPHLLSGISPRGYGHRCIGVGGRLVFDPHPSRAGLLTIYSVGLLVPR